MPHLNLEQWYFTERQNGLPNMCFPNLWSEIITAHKKSISSLQNGTKWFNLKMSSVHPLYQKDTLRPLRFVTAGYVHHSYIYSSQNFPKLIAPEIQKKRTVPSEQVVRKTLLACLPNILRMLSVFLCQISCLKTQSSDKAHRFLNFNFHISGLHLLNFLWFQQQL